MAALPAPTVSMTVEAIEAAVAAKAERRQDAVVRASAIGKCERHLWYKFRWAQEPESFPPRILRLFETGHLEEARMVGWLQDAGIDVLPLDPETEQQWEVVSIDGHFKGHLDGICERVPEAPKTPHLLECKTHNAKSFAQLVKHGVEISKPEHYAQMQVYMHLKGLTRALYLAKNKDTDELHVERIQHDVSAAVQLIAKAARVVAAHGPPGRISEDPNWFECKFCPSREICHGAATALRNCRTCMFSTPAPDGRWVCERYGLRTPLGYSLQKQGCPKHRYLPGLVSGEQVDVSNEYDVTYRMADGAEWIDRGPSC